MPQLNNTFSLSNLKLVDKALQCFNLFARHYDVEITSAKQHTHAVLSKEAHATSYARNAYIFNLAPRSVAVNSWQLRMLLALISAAVLLASLYLGYEQQLSPEAAAELVRLIEESERVLLSSGDAPEIALRLFVAEALAVLACSLPGVGPAMAVYLSYEAGRYAKAAEIAGLVKTSQIFSPSDALHLIVLCIAMTESMYLTIALFRRKRLEILETAALIVLALSLVALISVLEVAFL